LRSASRISVQPRGCCLLFNRSDIRNHLLNPSENVLVFLSMVSDDLVVVQDLLSFDLDKLVNGTLDHDDNQLIVTVLLRASIGSAQELVNENKYLLNVDLLDDVVHYFNQLKGALDKDTGHFRSLLVVLMLP
jgi:hypothetical protein